MAKKELKEQLKSYEENINNISLVIDPCKMCKIYKKYNGWFMGEFKKGEWEDGECKQCCWFYDSKFEMEVDDNSCATCRHKAKMLTDKKPCKDCDNGGNWEK